MKMTLLPCQRDKFDIPADVSYLNCGYMSPLPNSVAEAGIVGVKRKSAPWVITAPDFFRTSERVRSLFAQLIGASSDDVAITPSASYGIALAASAVQVAPGQEILILAEQFPSNFYSWQEKARQCGGSVVTVPVPHDLDWTSALLDKISSRTAVVAVPNCHWTNGGLVDLVAVGSRCREVDAALVVDGTQSLGAHPFDLEKIGPDFLITATYKWLLGPYSLGFVYVAPRHLSAQPLEFSWLAREGSEDFAGLTEYTDSFQPGARKFDVGERANFALIPMAEAALEQILEWGVESISESLSVLAGRAAELAEASGFPPVPAHLRVGHMLGFDIPSSAPHDLVTQLADRNIYVSRRGRSLRVSPHLYNTPEDIDRLMSELGKLVA